MIIKMFNNFISENFIIDNSKSKIIDEITDMFIELKDSGLSCLVSVKNNIVEISISKNINRKEIINLDLLKDCVEMSKDYLCDFVDIIESYRFFYFSERVIARMTNNGIMYDKSRRRECEEYSNFPNNFITDIESKHELEYRFNYELESVKIIFKIK